jgi:hypothetical protein
MVYVAGSPSTAISTPARAGAGDHAHVPTKGIERARGDQLVPLDESRGERLQGRPLDPGQAGHRCADDEEHPELRFWQKCVQDKRPRARGEPELGDLHEPPPVERVRERPADERRNKERHERGEAQKPHHEGRARQLVRLVRQRNERDHRAEEGNALSDEEEAIVPVTP